MEKQLSEKGQEINSYIKEHNIQVRGGPPGASDGGATSDKKDKEDKEDGEAKKSGAATGVLVSAPVKADAS